MRDKSKLKHVMIQAKVSCDTAERIDDIVKKYGFSSRYEVMQYVLSAFLSKADPGYSNEEEQSRDAINEFGKLFEGFENKRNRIITTKPRGIQTLKLVNSIYIFSEVGKKGYVSRNMKVDAEGVRISNRSETSISSVIRYLYPKMAEKLDSVGKGIGSNRYEEIIEYMLEGMEVRGADEVGEEVMDEMNEISGVTRYGNVPVKARKRVVNDEQGL
ncbi:MAG: hypothetical protein [Bacteriophage sp.]|nr:MAG: hypothetical protein [Bacteriophage sp.]